MNLLMIEPDRKVVETAVLGLLLSLVLVQASTTPEPPDLPEWPDRVQQLHACVRTSAYLPWPLNTVSRSGHKGTVITLTFKRRHSEKHKVIASFGSKSRLVTRDPSFSGRLRVSGENSGVFLNGISLDDGGLFTARARSDEGRTWTRSTNLTVHLRPIVKGDKLVLEQEEPLAPGGAPEGGLHCVRLTCGLLEYAGYPPVNYLWRTTDKLLAEEAATDESRSQVDVCGPFTDHVTCSITGKSSTCIYDYIVSTYLDLPGPSPSTVKSAGGSSDLLLMVLVPLLTVGVPLIILAVWVMSHVMGDRSRRRANRSRTSNIEDSALTQPSPHTEDILDDGVLANGILGESTPRSLTRNADNRSRGLDTNSVGRSGRATPDSIAKSGLSTFGSRNSMAGNGTGYRPGHSRAPDPINIELIDTSHDTSIDTGEDTYVKTLHDISDDHSTGQSTGPFSLEDPPSDRGSSHSMMESFSKSQHRPRSRGEKRVLRGDSQTMLTRRGQSPILAGNIGGIEGRGDDGQEEDEPEENRPLMEATLV